MKSALVTASLWVAIVAAVALPAFAQTPTFGAACGGKPTVKILGSQSFDVICGKAWTPTTDGAVDSANADGRTARESRARARGSFMR